MAKERVCSSLIFPQTNDEHTTIDILGNLSIIYDLVLLQFLMYGGPLFVAVNVFAMFILTRKELRTSYNIVFLVMTFDQGIIILCRDILVWPSYYSSDGCGITFTLGWRLLQIGLINFCAIFSAHVSWLAVIITVVRLRHIRSSSREPTSRFMIVLCCVSFVLLVIASIPLFVYLDIEWVEMTVNCDGRGFEPRQSPIVMESDRLYANDCLLLRILFFWSGLVYNAVPCGLLFGLSFALIFHLRKIHKAHAELADRRSAATSANSNRSSWLLAMIVFTTLITDVPQAVINILLGFMSDRFRTTVVVKISSFIVTLVMIASAANLTIHLCMSKRFREIAKGYLCCACTKFKSRKLLKILET